MLSDTYQKSSLIGLNKGCCILNFQIRSWIIEVVFRSDGAQFPFVFETSLFLFVVLSCRNGPNFSRCTFGNLFFILSRRIGPNCRGCPHCWPHCPNGTLHFTFWLRAGGWMIGKNLFLFLEPGIHVPNCISCPCGPNNWCPHRLQCMICLTLGDFQIGGRCGRRQLGTMHGPWKSPGGPKSTVDFSVVAWLCKYSLVSLLSSNWRLLSTEFVFPSSSL